MFLLWVRKAVLSLFWYHTKGSLGTGQTGDPKELLLLLGEVVQERMGTIPRGEAQTTAQEQSIPMRLLPGLGDLR